MKNATVMSFSVLLALSTISLPLSAQSVTQEMASEKAMSFFAGKKVPDGASNKMPRKAPQLQMVNYSDGLYIFNDVANSGYVIVSGDERMPEILGYSLTGHIDVEKMPCCMKAVLDDYQRQVEYLRANPGFKPEKFLTSQQTPVAPLLGATAWDQGWPYNAMCPTIGGNLCLTGCAATAMAQAMYYFKWPQRGKGSISYEWNGQTLSADFSKSEYKWSLMTPTYQYNSSQESIDAVALLMRDVGYACKMNYGINVSGGGDQGKALIEHFDYDASMGYLERDYCDFEMWNNTIVDELANGRPMLYDAGSASGAHALVIDGIDSEGYYHFNWGLGGDYNGYYTMKTIHFNASAHIYFGIMKNQGGSPRYLFGCNSDFLYDSESNSLHGYGINSMSAIKLVEFYRGIAIENTKTHKVVYDSDGLNYSSFRITKSLSDGNYIVYPVARKDQSADWQKVIFRDNRQSFVDLNVKNGNMTFSNNHIYDGMQDDAIEVDNIFYFLDNNTHHATVTFKNDGYNSYKGDVTIPQMITVDKVNYTVDKIGPYAFRSCTELGTVTIPRTVKTIDNGFVGSFIDRIVFEKGSQLNTVTGFSFQGVQFKYQEMDFPEGLTQLPLCLFQYANISKITLPSTINYIGDLSFNITRMLRTVIMNGNPPSSVYDNSFTGFDFSLATLFVPKGKAAVYQNANVWKNFGQIVEMSDTATIGGMKYILSDTDNTAYLITVYNLDETNITIPSKVVHRSKRYYVRNLGPYLFANSKVHKLVVPSTVNYFGEALFYNGYCNLRQLHVGNKVPPTVAEVIGVGKTGFNTFFVYDYMYDYIELHVPTGCKSKYKNDIFWGKFANIIEDASLDEEEINLGDVNDDGIISIIDVIYLVNKVIGQAPSDFVENNADLNDDGDFTITDVMLLVNMLVGE